MNFTSTTIAYRDTGFYSSIIHDYLEGKSQLQPFYEQPVSLAGIKAAMEQRSSYPTDRKLLVDVLQQHYAGENPAKRQQQNISLLSNSNCFTITTAHQPNIFTGHLYFIYKIMHVIKLCEKLKMEMPENDFVPVFYMGSEDADLDELGHVYINGIKHNWETKQAGAVGRMKVDKALLKILDDIEAEISVQPQGGEITTLLKTCYTLGTTIEQATFKLINALFGDYGLIVFLPDHAGYKSAFIPVAAKELKTTFSYPIVAETVATFPKEYKVQAGGRQLNLFYLKDDRRDRIEKQDGQFTITDTGTGFSEAEIIQELHANPERFSPNVILRPVFQEMLLPDIAFIGGGGELAYWLELKNVFAAVQVPFPVLVLRNSFMLVEKRYAEKAKELGFSMNELFKPEQALMHELVKRETTVQLDLDKEKETLHNFYKQLGNTAGAVDTTLRQHTEALEKRALNKLEALEKKMLRAEKKKFEARQRQLHKLRSQLFPLDNLQERIENFLPFYAKWGTGFIKTVYAHSLALEQQFVVLAEL